MTYAQAMTEARRQYWQQLMDETGGKRVEMQRISGLSKTKVYMELRQLGFAPALPRHVGNAAWKALEA